MTRPAASAVNRSPGVFRAGLGTAAVLTALLLLQPWEGPGGLGQLRYPAETAGRLSDRHWNFYEGIAHSSDLTQGWYRVLFGTPESVRQANLAVLREVLAYFDGHPQRATDWGALNARARLVVGLAEFGRRDALERQLYLLQTTPEGETLAAAVRYAYALGEGQDYAAEVVTGLSFMPLGWAADRLALRIAERRGDRRGAARLRGRLLAEGSRLRRDALWLSGLVGGAVLVGLGLLARGAVRRLAGTGRRPGWSLRDGVEVLAWSAVAAAAVAALLQALPGSYFRPHPAAAWTALLAVLPMLWLVQRRLLRPQGLGALGAFGLALPRAAWGGVGRAALALFALSAAGSILLVWAGGQLGLVEHWSSSLYEPMVFGPASTAWLAAVALALWSPVAEELAFRGLLFGSLRQSLGVPLGALVAAGLFALLHRYSPVGFLIVLWSALVLSWGYQRTRSLLPGIIAHAAGNLVTVAVVVLFYR